MVKNEMAIRKDRIHKERDILQAVLPYVAIALAFVMLISVTWLVVKRFWLTLNNNKVNHY